MTSLSIISRKRVEFVDITRDIQNAIVASGIQSGQALVFTPHTTAAITINENADPDVLTDLVSELNTIVPFEDGYLHGEGNSAAHLKSSLIGASENLIVENGMALLGTWQGIFFCEFDGPRQRHVHIRVSGK